MAKKFAKTLVGIGAAAVAGKVAYDKYKTVKEAFTKEENESVDAEVKKYNAIFEKKVVEVEEIVKSKAGVSADKITITAVKNIEK